MSGDVTFTISSIPFDEDYRPADNTRITTNFANLARGESRQANLRNTLAMINNRFNSLMHWDNPTGDRYAVALSIVTVELGLDDAHADERFPLIEMLETAITDRRSGARIGGRRVAFDAGIGFVLADDSGGGAPMVGLSIRP